MLLLLIRILLTSKKGSEMKLFVLAAACLLVFSGVQAGIMDGPGNPHLSNGDIIIGGKLAFVGVYGAGVGFIFDGEYGLKEGFLSIPNFPTSLGVGASIGYSSYSQDVPYWGKYSYTNFLILANAIYHVKLLKNIPMDTYLVLNLGLNIATDSYDGAAANAPSASDSNGGLKFGTGVGARYYFTNRLAAVGELGYGMGTIRLGLDFKIK